MISATGGGGKRTDTNFPADGDALLRMASALANPHRLRLLALLYEERQFVSALARAMSLSRPLVHMHLQLLEAAGLVVGSLELGEGGTAMKWYEVAPFAVELTPARVAELVQTLTVRGRSGQS